MLAEQDKDTAEEDKAEIVERMALVANDEAPEVAQPGTEPLDAPAAPKAPQWTAVLGLGAFPAAPMRRDHLDAQVQERLVERIGVVGAVANEAQGQGVYETGVERGRRGRDEGNLVRRSRSGTRGERKTKTVCHCRHCPPMPMRFEPLPRLVFPTQPPPRIL
jgi:hypothetical protein